MCIRDRSINFNSYATDFDCLQHAYHRPRGLLDNDEIASYAKQVAVNSTLDGHADYDEHYAEPFNSAGLGWDGVTAHGESITVLNSTSTFAGLSAGGSAGNNLNFTMNPAHGMTGVGITGASGEYRRDNNIVSTKYGAVLKLPDDATKEHGRYLFLIEGCNVTIRDLAIVGEYNYDFEKSLEIAGAYLRGTYGFMVRENAHLICHNVGIKDVKFPFYCMDNGNVTMNKVTTGNAKYHVYGWDGSHLKMTECSFVGAYHSSMRFENSNVKIDHCAIVGSRNHGIVNYGNRLDIRRSLILWTGQYPYSRELDTIRRIAPTANNTQASYSTAYRCQQAHGPQTLSQEQIGMRAQSMTTPGAGHQIWAGQGSYVEIDMLTACHGSGIYGTSAEIRLENSIIMNNTNAHLNLVNTKADVDFTCFFNTAQECIQAANCSSIDVRNCSFLYWGSGRPYTLGGDQYAIDLHQDSTTYLRDCIFDGQNHSLRDVSYGGIDGMQSVVYKRDSHLNWVNNISKRHRFQWEVLNQGTGRTGWSTFDQNKGTRGEGGDFPHLHCMNAKRVNSDSDRGDNLQWYALYFTRDVSPAGTDSVSETHYDFYRDHYLHGLAYETNVQSSQWLHTGLPNDEKRNCSNWTFRNSHDDVNFFRHDSGAGSSGGGFHN